MKKIWIAGASGMLGSHFKRLLMEKQIPFLANDHKQIDITQLDSVSDFIRIQKITHVINCAAYTQVDQAEIEQKEAYLANAVGPHNLGIAGRRHGARIIHFSTDYVFDGLGRRPYDEEHFCAPSTSYGLSKLAGEIKLMDEHEDTCIIRTSWLFGFPGKNFVETILRLINEQEHLRVVSDQVGRPTYCGDLAEAALELLDEEGIYHFANSSETSWFDFAKEIHNQAVQLNFPSIVKVIEPIPSSQYPAKAKRPAYSTLSTKKIEEELNVTPRPWKEALRDYLTLYKAHQLSLQPI